MRIEKYLMMVHYNLIQVLAMIIQFMVSEQNKKGKNTKNKSTISSFFIILFPSEDSDNVQGSLIGSLK